GLSNPAPEVFLAAKQLEMEANLDVALAVAKKDWKNAEDRAKAFDWLAAADAVAQNINDLRGDVSALPTARFDVIKAAAQVGLEIPDAEQLDEYAQAMRSEPDKYLEKTLDEVSAAAVRWKAGCAAADFVKIYEMRKDYKQAIVCGLKGVEYFQLALKFRDNVGKLPLGLLQARLGVDFANGLKNAKEALPRLDAANSLFKAIESDLKPSDAAEVGARLAAAGSAYWKAEKRDEGLDAMRRAVTLIEFAVKEKAADKGALYVPYANLSTMYKGLQKADEAAKYAKLAKGVAPTK
ncbi:MAG: hypothetical protein HUK22_06635, partial [Thermoguttaceae bacterium]|nr:hypothetical protein [Thermoguttaceae bacterium]